MSAVAGVGGRGEINLVTRRERGGRKGGGGWGCWISFLQCGHGMKVPLHAFLHTSLLS